MTIVIPMAGLGSRFASAGYELPKPLIPAGGEPMYRWSVRSLRPLPGERLIFVLRRTDYTERLVSDIEETFAESDLHIEILEEETRGQLDTVLRIEHLVDPESSLVIHNADTAFSLVEPIAETLVGWDGGWVVFDSTEDRWSFARTETDESVRIVETTEKIPISRHASTGTYAFSRAAVFFESARAEIAANPNHGGEYYIAPLYNDLIADGERYRTIRASEVFCFGTPADLEEAEPRFIRALNDGSFAGT